jgi:hypothetical protein
MDSSKIKKLIKQDKIMYCCLFGEERKVLEAKCFSGAHGQLALAFDLILFLCCRLGVRGEG